MKSTDATTPCPRRSVLLLVGVLLPACGIALTHLVRDTRAYMRGETAWVEQAAESETGSADSHQSEVDERRPVDGTTIEAEFGASSAPVGDIRAAALEAEGDHHAAAEADRLRAEILSMPVCVLRIPRESTIAELRQTAVRLLRQGRPGDAVGVLDQLLIIEPADLPARFLRRVLTFASSGT